MNELLGLEVGAKADEWGPHVGERSYGTQLLERGREEQGRGSFVFSQCVAHLDLARHVHKNARFW
jgi:hypothetical protein